MMIIFYSLFLFFLPFSNSVIYGGPLRSEYQLVQYHAHFGMSDDCKGCEHVVDNRFYPGEIHFVHFNTNYKTVAEALNHDDGLAVIGFFLKVGPGGESAKAFQETTEFFRLCRFKGHEVDLPQSCSKILEMYPTKDLSRYWTYRGSLTGPPLSEAVVWLMMEEPMEITAQQMAALRDLHHLDTFENTVANYREVQPLNGRTLKMSFLANDPDGTPCSE